MSNQAGLDVAALAAELLKHLREVAAPSENDLLEREQAADYLHICVDQLDALARKGKITRIKLGSGRARVLYRRRDLDAYLDRHVIAAKN